MPAGHVDVDGGRLWFERDGEGFPVVLIHGALLDSRMWDPQFEAFARQHDVIRYDLRGYGRSDRPDRGYSDLGDLEMLLAGLDVGRCALVGCSVGARLAVDFALAFPAVADAIVPVSPLLSGWTWRDRGIDMLRGEVDEALSAGKPELAMEIELAVWAPVESDETTDGRIRKIAMDNLAIFDLDDALFDAPARAVDRLEDVDAATLVVVGDRDLAEIHLIADTLVERVPGALKRVIAGGDQLVNLRRPERFDRVVLDFLSFRM